jgi:hypothetical protein
MEAMAVTELYVYRSAATGALIPAVVTTSISTVPTVPAGAVAVMLVLLLTVKLVAGVLPKITAVVPVNPVPEIVTVVPPATGPAAGLIPVTSAPFPVIWTAPASIIPDVGRA